MQNKKLIVFSILSVIFSFMWFYTHIFHHGLTEISTLTYIFYKFHVIFIVISFFGIFLFFKNYNKEKDNKTFTFYFLLNFSYPIFLFIFLIFPYFHALFITIIRFINP